MGRLRVLSGSEICRILEQNGFVAVRQRGSHRVMQKRLETTTITVPVPLHDHSISAVPRASIHHQFTAARMNELRYLPLILLLGKGTATNSLSAVASASESLFTARERAANRTAALSSGCWNLPKRVQERRSGMATQKISGGSLQISSLGWVECVPDLACRREGVKLCSCVFRDSRACCSGRTSEAWFARGER